MDFWTYGQIRTKVEKDLDLENETIIQAEEMLGYANEGIKMVETAIHSLKEDYFLSNSSIALVSGTQDYALPSDIYANKIRNIFYNDGSRKYEVKRVKNLNTLPFIESDEDYQYLLVNTTASGNRIKLYPTSRETSSSVMPIWYLRSANVMVDDNSICDIPEYVYYVIGVMKIMCKFKENLDASAQAAALKKIEDQLYAALKEKTDDGDNLIPFDNSFYGDFDHGGF